jgi:tRNA modification GTPase TrmE
MKATSLDDIIAAISTPAGSGGISIVRISGEGCIHLANTLFSGADLNKKESHTISFGYIKNPINNTVIDEVLVSVMRAPKTYTRDDVVEINCHGGTQSSQKVLEIFLNEGARLAEPGEFTKRAFLNGRIDLTQAEAVIDIINAKTDLGRQSAVNQLEGSIAKTVGQLRDTLLTSIATIEASIDYPEHDIEEETYGILRTRITEILEKTQKLIESADKGKIIREGISTVILGKPNVGKSSLLNYLLDEERAIVTDIPGTTRDTVEELINIGGVPVKIVDTAGIRDTQDKVEKIGVEKSKEYANKADLILMMVDTSRGITVEDRQILDIIRDKKAIVILNKIDLPNKIDINEICDIVSKKNIISVSAKDGTGIDELTSRIKDLFFWRRNRAK